MAWSGTRSQPHLPRGRWRPAAELEGRGRGQGVSRTLWPGRGIRETDPREGIVGVGTEGILAQPAPARSSVLAGHAHQTGAQSWPPAPLKQAAVPPGGWLGRKGQEPGKITGTEPHSTLGTARSRSGWNEGGATGTLRSHRTGPSSLSSPLPQAMAAQAQMRPGDGTRCPHTPAGPAESEPACPGLWPREAPGAPGCRGGQGQGLGGPVHP